MFFILALLFHCIRAQTVVFADMNLNGTPTRFAGFSNECVIQPSPIGTLGNTMTCNGTHWISTTFLPDCTTPVDVQPGPLGEEVDFGFGTAVVDNCSNQSEYTIWRGESCGGCGPTCYPAVGVNAWCQALASDYSLLLSCNNDTWSGQIFSDLACTDYLGSVSGALGQTDASNFPHSVRVDTCSLAC